jgi:hypothetical protein
VNRPKKGPNPRNQKDCQMIWKVYFQSRGMIGTKAIVGTLKNQFLYMINHKRFARLVWEIDKSRPCVEHNFKYTGILHEESAETSKNVGSFCMFIGKRK